MSDRNKGTASVLSTCSSYALGALGSAYLALALSSCAPHIVKPSMTLPSQKAAFIIKQQDKSISYDGNMSHPSHTHNRLNGEPLTFTDNTFTDDYFYAHKTLFKTRVFSGYRTNATISKPYLILHDDSVQVIDYDCDGSADEATYRKNTFVRPHYLLDSFEHAFLDVLVAQYDQDVPLLLHEQYLDVRERLLASLQSETPVKEKITQNPLRDFPKDSAIRAAFEQLPESQVQPQPYHLQDGKTFFGVVDYYLRAAQDQVHIRIEPGYVQGSLTKRPVLFLNVDPTLRIIDIEADGIPDKIFVKKQASAPRFNMPYVRAQDALEEKMIDDIVQRSANAFVAVCLDLAREQDQNGTIAFSTQTRYVQVKDDLLRALK